MLSTDSALRKEMPIWSGVLRYFPDALAAVARLSKLGNDKHNPGEPLHWAKGKSADQEDCCVRHLVDLGIIDPDDGAAHDVKLAWRALANLQTRIEAGQQMFDEAIIKKNAEARLAKLEAAQTPRAELEQRASLLAEVPAAAIAEVITDSNSKVTVGEMTDGEAYLGVTH